MGISSRCYLDIEEIGFSVLKFCYGCKYGHIREAKYLGRGEYRVEVEE